MPKLSYGFLATLCQKCVAALISRKKRLPIGRPCRYASFV